MGVTEVGLMFWAAPIGLLIWLNYHKREHRRRQRAELRRHLLRLEEHDLTHRIS